MKVNKEELFNECLSTKNNVNKASKWNDLNEKYGYPFPSGENLRCWFKAEAVRRIRNGLLNKKEVYPGLSDEGEKVVRYNETQEILADGSQKSDKLIKINSPEELKDTRKIMQLHGYDPDLWEVVKVSNSIWNAQVKGGGKTELYASKLQVKPRAEFSTVQIEDAFNNIIPKTVNPIKEYTNYDRSGKIIEIALTDFHYGMLSWEGETGVSFNLDIAENKFCEIMGDIVSKISNFGIQKIYFVFCHDFFHCNNQENTTNKGTAVDVAGRMLDIFNRGVKMLTTAIDYLETLAPVETVYLHSNHSADTSYYAIKCLEAYYRTDTRVTVDAGATPRKYRAFGKCLLGMSHGDNEGKRAANIMQLEVPELFGKAKYRELHLGHLHHEVVEDNGGVVVRYLPSPAPSDNWHTKSGFIGTQKKIQTFVWDENKGVEYIIQTPVEY